MTKKDKSRSVDAGRWVTDGKKPYSNVKVPDANKKAIEEMNKKKKGK